jgi:type I restriction enzyme S subunit
MRKYLRAANVGWEGLILDDVKSMNFTDEEMSTFRLKSGDLLLNEASGSPKEVGKPALWNDEIDECAFQNTLLRVRPYSSVDSRYLLQFFNYQAVTGAFARGARGVGIHHLGREALSKWLIPLPSLEEQRRIAAILDQADALRAERRQAISSLQGLTQAFFHHLFGDAFSNPLDWPLHTLGSIALGFSDGPFGSNLKSSHYTPDGVRVVRLQNIGVGEFIDADRAFIDPDHFAKLSRHECRPGDVLIGTLGDPNLRACIQPEWLKIALNKADCVQMRVNPAYATPEFVSALLNAPGTLKRANALVLGQTRSRISMGRLRELPVPLPPLALQIRFTGQIRRVAKTATTTNHVAGLEKELFASLQSRAFRGEL